MASELRARGHDVSAPTLTGMGERFHLGRRDVGLATHVQDLVSVLEFEDLEQVTMVAHSYGGLPATGAADRCADRVRLLIYVDALVPSDGQSALDLLPPAFGEVVRTSLEASEDGWRVPIPAELLPPEGVASAIERSRYVARLRDQPSATFSEPIHLTGAIERVPRAFVRCTAGDLAGAVGSDPIAPLAAQAAGRGWPYRELSAPHDPQLADPAGTAAVLLELAVAGSPSSETKQAG